MQRRPGGARVDRGCRISRLAASASARSGVVRPPSPHRLQAGLMLMSEMNCRDFRRWPRLLGCAATVIACLMWAMPAARAELQIEITSGVRDPIPIAIVPFAHTEGPAADIDVADIVQHDLEGSGRFRALPRDRMPANPSRADEVAGPAWKAVGTDYVVVGHTTALDNGNLAVDFALVNTLTGARLAAQRFTGSPGAMRNAAHKVSDVVYQKILGVRGAFATRIAYVAVLGEAPSQHYQLIVADADGANQHMILESRFPLMSA